MIKLLRNIRKNIISEKPSFERTTNYLKYAIGEIFLVVIGILIALQVNNWNENRKTKIEEKKLLHQLEIEFQDNQNQLTNIIYQHKSVNYSLRKLLAAIKPKPEKIPQDSLTKYLQQLSYIPVYKPNKGTITTLLSTDKISIISNDSLAILLSHWPEHLETYQYTASFIYNLYQYQILPYTVENLHFRNIMLDEGFGNTGPSGFSLNQEKILSDSKLENLAELRRAAEENMVLDAIKLKEDQAKILKLIKRQLSKK